MGGHRRVCPSEKNPIFINSGPFLPGGLRSDDFCKHYVLCRPLTSGQGYDPPARGQFPLFQPRSQKGQDLEVAEG